MHGVTRNKCKPSASLGLPADHFEFSWVWL